MPEHILTAKLTIDQPGAKVFEFFADARNLERITPPELNFKITSPQPVELKKGALIDYRLKLNGIPMKWRTEITEWNPPFEFVDTQLRGPYKQWIHTHRFTENAGGGTEIEDVVRYRLPLEPFGDLAHFIVRRQLNRIFEYRQRIVKEIFCAVG